MEPKVVTGRLRRTQDCRPLLEAVVMRGSNRVTGRWLESETWAVLLGHGVTRGSNRVTRRVPVSERIAVLQGTRGDERLEQGYGT